MIMIDNLIYLVSCRVATSDVAEALTVAHSRQITVHRLTALDTTRFLDHDVNTIGHHTVSLAAWYVYHVTCMTLLRPALFGIDWILFLA